MHHVCNTLTFVNGKCPSCGYCPCCGRVNVNPWVQRWPIVIHPQPYWGTSAPIYVGSAGSAISALSGGA